MRIERPQEHETEEKQPIKNKKEELLQVLKWGCCVCWAPVVNGTSYCPDHL